MGVFGCFVFLGLARSYILIKLFIHKMSERSNSVTERRNNMINRISVFNFLPIAFTLFQEMCESLPINIVDLILPICPNFAQICRFCAKVSVFYLQS